MKSIYRPGIRKSLSLLILMIITGICSCFVLAQNPDNPLLDQVPAAVRRQISGSSRFPLPGNIITVNNWDNYGLGTDFAESNIAVHPRNAAWFFTAYNINGTHHTEDGTDWAINNPGWTNMAGDPVVAYDSIGNLYYINLYGDPITGAKIVTSGTNGMSWSDPVLATSGNDKCWLACDQTNGPFANYVYACMSNGTNGYFARSTNHGQTFENTFNVSTQTLPGMSICVGPYNNIQGGSVIVVTNSGDPFASTYTFYRSTNGGANFTLMSSQQFAGYVGTDVNGRSSVEGMRTRPYPNITADNSYGPNRGRLYCVYASNDPPGNGNRPDIWCRYSMNGGTTWSAAKRVNDDPNPQSNHQWHPAAWCDKQTGKLYIQWMDSRDTPTHDSAYIYATYSDDGGISFKPNQQISNQKMKIDCPTCGGTGTPRYQGDYNGIISNKKVSMAGWTDFRDETFMSVTSYFPDFAMSLDKASDSLFAPSDSIDIVVSVPGVKLYSDTVLLSASVSPSPSPGNLSVSFPGGNRIVSFPGSKVMRIKSSGTIPLGYYNALVQAEGPNGTPIHQRTLTIKVKSTQYITVSTNAIPPDICPGSTSQLMANAQGGVGAYTYAWLPATNLNNPSVRNPLASPVVTTVYHVRVSDTGGHTTEDSVQVTIMHVPSTPGQIAGQDSVCRDSNVVFSISPVPGATSYSWTVPGGVAIQSGQNTPTIEVKWNNSDGVVSVIAGNACGNSNPSVKPISVLSVPVSPGLINGPDSACVNSPEQFSVEDVPGAAKYYWTVPAGANITGGQDTRSIMVTWGNSVGTVSVVAGNDCGNSNPQSKLVGIKSFPDAPGAIAGKDTVCVNHSDIHYAVPVITAATSYFWELPAGAYITSGEGTASIVVTFGPESASGQVSVQGMNSCGAGATSQKFIVVKTCTGIPEKETNPAFQIYPNPADNIIHVIFLEADKSARISLMNIEGVEMYRQGWENISPGFRAGIDVSSYSRGIYYIILVNKDHVLYRKVILR